MNIENKEPKKKVGILSMQRIKNYGSFLQAYGLRKMIESLGHEVEFVDYRVGEAIIQEKNEKHGIGQKLSKGMEVFKYNAKMSHKFQYILHKKNFAKKYFNILGITENSNYTPELDTLVIGSDEVFNCIQKNPNVGYSLDLFGKDNNAKRLISYAASFGNTTLEKLEKYNKKDEIGSLLKEFDAISVRDDNSGKIIETLTKKDINYNLDPVLMYDYMNECKEIPDININEKYMIVYAYNGRISDKESEYIKKFAKARNLKIYSIGGAQGCADKFIDCSPFEVLAYFKKAELVVTDTFHGSIFSIITKRKFATLVRKSVGNNYGNEEKLTDLLKRLNLNDRIIYDIFDLETKINKEIDYNKVEEILKLERANTLNYLKNEL